MSKIFINSTGARIARPTQDGCTTGWLAVLAMTCVYGYRSDRAGRGFDQVIQEKLKAVQVAVVLIGEHWLDIADANGQRRLDHPDDWVRLEIAALLERNIRVIPVLVGGAADKVPSA